MKQIKFTLAAGLITALLLSACQSSSMTGAPGGSSSAPSSYAATFTVDNTTASKTGESYSSSEKDKSAVLAINGGQLTLNGSTITTTGETSSADNSSFYGLNAAVLSAKASTIKLSDSRVSTTGSGANGVFATGTGSSVQLSNVTITATGDGGHAVMATQGGALDLINVNMNTAGAHSGAIATDRGSGTINVKGGVVETSGAGSPDIYSTGLITVSDAVMTATGSEVAVIEGANNIVLNNTILRTSKANLWGVMIYQSFSGDAEGSHGSFSMTGGELTASGDNSPLFHITNATGTIVLKGVAVSVKSGTLISATIDQWGTSGSNGGHAVLTADGQTLSGDLVADNISTLDVTLQNQSALSGAINTAKSAKSATLTLDATSTWNVTADSTLTCLNDAAGINGTTISNITGNGHTVYYDKATCPALNGGTYTLAGSGTLTPMG